MWNVPSLFHNNIHTVKLFVSGLWKAWHVIYTYIYWQWWLCLTSNYICPNTPKTISTGWVRFHILWDTSYNSSSKYAKCKPAHLGCLCYCWNAFLQSWYAGHWWDCPCPRHTGSQRSVTGYCGTSGSHLASACWKAVWGGKRNNLFHCGYKILHEILTLQTMFGKTFKKAAVDMSFCEGMLGGNDSW